MKSFIICLSRIPASLKTATELKENLENTGMEVELFEGTYGSDATRLMEEEGRTIHPFGLKGPLDPGSRDANKISTPGVRGCFLSHFNLWKKCVELNEPIIIWEDDIILHRGFQEVEWNDVLILALGHPMKSPRWMHLLESPEGEPRALPYTSPSMPGCCGYAIKPHAAKKLIDTYEKTFLPADNAINRNIISMQIHNYIMGIAIVDGKKSLTRAKAWKDA